MKHFFLVLILSCIHAAGMAQEGPVIPADSTPSRKKWDWVEIKGYTQLRYNELFETNPDLECEQCDKSWGTDAGFFFRRMRFSVDLKLLPRLTFSIQPDISGLIEAGPPVSTRDVYFEYRFDKKNEFRARLGQTRIPYGHENLQSTRSRIPLDRNDALNSSFINERDWGLFLYWTPEKFQKQFEARAANGLRGVGDYGIVSFGVFQGQSTYYDLNRNKHLVARVTYPFDVGTQLMEVSLQGYTGKYTIADSKMSPGVQTVENKTYPDRRVAVSGILYPKPFGIQAEYNYGIGPEFTQSTGKITTQPLWGGYVMLNCRIPVSGHVLYPYMRVQHFDGAKKHELDARHYLVKELEFGIEWQLSRYVDFNFAYTFSDRSFEDFRLPDNDQIGSLARMQLQVGF